MNPRVKPAVCQVNKQVIGNDDSGHDEVDGEMMG